MFKSAPHLVASTVLQLLVSAGKHLSHSEIFNVSMFLSFLVLKEVFRELSIGSLSNRRKLILFKISHVQGAA